MSLKPASDDLLQAILALVCCDVSLHEVATWRPEQKLAAENWAIKTLLKASDNPVRVPPMPEILKPFYDPMGGENLA